MTANFTPYRRHETTCKYAGKGRLYFRCGCPIYADNNTRGSGRAVRSMGTRDWETALAQVLEWNKTGSAGPVVVSGPTTISEAIEIFKRSLAGRQLQKDTIYKYELMFRGLRAFAAEKKILAIGDLTAETLHEFRSTWIEQNLTVVKKLDRLKAFGNFAVQIGWLKSSPASGIRPPKVRVTPTMPFSDDEMTRMLAALADMLDDAPAGARPNFHRLRALVLLLRYSGLRIGDALSCAVERLADKRLRIYTQKTGQHVHVALPDFVIRALETTPRRCERFWFLTENGSQLETAVKDWQGRLRALGARAKIEHLHAHRFRDTFAVKLLLDGTPIERVSILLGHSSIRVTEKHYSPWIRDRQEQAEADVRRSWQRDPLFLLESAAARVKVQ